MTERTLRFLDATDQEEPEAAPLSERVIGDFPHRLVLNRKSHCFNPLR